MGRLTVQQRAPIKTSGNVTEVDFLAQRCLKLIGMQRDDDGGPDEPPPRLSGPVPRRPVIADSNDAQPSAMKVHANGRQRAMRHRAH
jgi:hypothetical protein